VHFLGEVIYMIDFRTPKISDKPWVDALLAHAAELGCEYNFTNLFIWNHAFSQKLASVDGFLTVRLTGSAGCGYLWPIGQGNVKNVLLEMEADAKERGVPFRLICMAPAHIHELEALYPGKFQYITDRNGSDYIYDINRLADLKGKKLHAKRNHCNRMEADCPDWRYEDLTPDSLAECLVVNKEWYRRAAEREGEADEVSMQSEETALTCAFSNFEALGLEGGLLRVYGEVVAFTIADRLNADTYDVHFEKAYSELPGAFSLINRELARSLRSHHPELRYLNREEDMGIEGLRKSKESYYPDMMAEKLTAIKVKE